MIGFKRLSSSAISKYNYVLTKKNVDDFMMPLYELIFKFRSISPPRVTMSIKEVNIQNTNNPLSKVESYVIKKIETENQVREYYNIIETILEMFTDEERICFKSIYFDSLTEEDTADILNVSVSKLVKIRKSCIIKFALSLDIAVLKGEEK